MISYGMYLLHMIAMQAARRVPGVANHGNGVVFVAATIIAISLATISYWMFESWILRLKDRFRPQRVDGAVELIHDARRESK